VDDSAVDTVAGTKAGELENAAAWETRERSAIDGREDFMMYSFG